MDKGCRWKVWPPEDPALLLPSNFEKMYRIILVLTLFLIHPFLSPAQTKEPDMTAFGYKLGEKLPLSECKCKVVETSEGIGLSTKHYKSYAYVDPFPVRGGGDCIKRSFADLEKYKVRKRDQLDSLHPVTNGTVEVQFDLNNAPKICVTGKFSATLVDSKLTAVAFTIATNAADEVFETLKKKYGPNPVVKNYQMQNGYGATQNYYIAVWSFPHLTVIMQSSNHGSLNDPFGTVAIEIPKKEEAPKDNRPL